MIQHTGAVSRIAAHRPDNMTVTFSDEHIRGRASENDACVSLLYFAIWFCFAESFWPVTAAISSGLAAPGDLDPSFGTGGKVTTRIENPGQGDDRGQPDRNARRLTKDA